MPYGRALIFAGLLIAMPGELTAQHYGGWRGGGHGYARGYGGGYASPYGYGGGYARPYGYGGGYSGYRGYAGYGGYGYAPRYYGGYYHHPYYGGYYGHPYYNGAWIAAGAGLLGVMIGSMIVPRPVYVYPLPPPQQQAAPATQQCPDGSVISVGSYCPAPPQAAPAPAPERGERG